MGVSYRFVQNMVEIWARRQEPHAADVQRVLHAAKVLEKDAGSPVHLRAFAWNLVVESHKAVGWNLPNNTVLPSCHAAAASLAHGASLLIDQISNSLQGRDGPVLVLGALAASRTLFDRWDMLPATGALLVPLDSDVPPSQSDSSDLSEVHQLRWAAPGKLRAMYIRHSTPVELDGTAVLVPTPELLTARNTHRFLQAHDPRALIFYAAALASRRRGGWAETLKIARVLGHRGVILDLAVAMGADKRLQLKIGRMKRLSITLRSRLRELVERRHVP